MQDRPSAISIADMELPQDISVYLEDTLNGTLTSLKDGDFELTAQSNLSGADRFFIVFKDNSVLSSGDYPWYKHAKCIQSKYR